MFEHIRLCLSLLLSVSVVPLPRYSYSEAPEFPGNDFADDPVDSDPADSFASFDTAEELGCDREVLQEAYAWQHIVSIDARLKVSYVKSLLIVLRSDVQPTRRLSTHIGQTAAPPMAILLRSLST